MPVQLVVNDAYAEHLRALRAVARGLWLGIVDYAQAWDALDVAIRFGLTKAWHEGLQEAGIQPDEMSLEERNALQIMIVNERSRMNEFLTYCEQNAKSTGAAWSKCDAKAQLWAMRAKDARNKALTMAKSDPKLMWTLGRTEKHCSTCSKLNGKVKRASYWRQLNLQPQNPPNHLLECQGWHCDCSLSPTEERLSKGTLGNLP